jgi:outer membrane cobalamin receptor
MKANYSLQLILCFLLVTSQAFTQNGEIQGHIIDNDNRAPIAGVTINIHNNNKADNSDSYGSFRISTLAEGQYELIASHIGYKTEIIVVEVRNNLASTVHLKMKKNQPDLSEVRINSKKTSGLNSFGQLDIMLRPVTTSQDVLRIVPGIFIAQHAGGGKAEQIFLRGFDIDHGTDINLSVDGMPVNMVSHAHGQGYADLHFLIPETIEKVAFEMGPYNSSKGNQATAGYVDFQTKDFLAQNSIKVEAGKFNTQRITGLLKILNKESASARQQLYVASEYFRNDSYFESPQNFHRLNLMGKYTAWYGNQSQLTIIASTFSSKWDASGQIPDRAVQSGTITRFGSIDNTEGGNTSRTNLNLRYLWQGKRNWNTSTQFYYSRYSFDLFSNFTFFLENPIQGDQIRQQEKRQLLGYQNSSSKTWMIGTKKSVTEIGGGFRHDKIPDISLSAAEKRSFIEYKQNGALKETNGFLYIDQQLELTDMLTASGGLRLDHFIFRYKNFLLDETAYRQQLKTTASPKLMISYSPSTAVKIFLNNGVGFHSNDSRVILNSEAREILPKVFGTDLGIVWKPVAKLIMKTTLWHLFSEQEFVYVGDAGIVEPGGKTRRLGIDLSGRYQVTNWLYADLDLNLSRAKAIEEKKGADYVPLAPSLTSIGGIIAKLKNGLSASLRYRYMKTRPANEINSIQATGYMITDLLASYRWKNLELTLSAENLLNREWNEAQFATESRLRMESAPVTEIHYTPGSPRYIKGTLTFNF